MMHQSERGLTKREEFAKAAMVGLLADPAEVPQQDWPAGANTCADAVAALAVEQADALIKWLNKTSRS
jgi:hypothetical protein